MLEPHRSASARWLRPRFRRTSRSTRPNVSASRRRSAIQSRSSLTYCRSSIMLQQCIDDDTRPMNGGMAMNESTRDSIRRIFINARPHVALMLAADLLGMPFPVLKHEIAEGTIVAVSVGVVGLRVPNEELIAAAMRIWPQAVIEEALGEEGRRGAPGAGRLGGLGARVSGDP